MITETSDLHRFECDWLNERTIKVTYLNEISSVLGVWAFETDDVKSLCFTLSKDYRIPPAHLQSQIVDAVKQFIASSTEVNTQGVAHA